MLQPAASGSNGRSTASTRTVQRARHAARRLAMLAAASCCAGGSAEDQAVSEDLAAPEESSGHVETVEVLAPLAAGDGAADWRSAAEADAAAGARTLANRLEGEAPAAFINEAQGNPLQPDLRLRGFVGSPLLGLPQGIAVFQDGARINEPFGDTVSWALVPEVAVSSVALATGANPLFGRNALGGTLLVRTKDGFSHPGARAAVAAGSFGRRTLAVEAGGSTKANGAAHYFGADALREDGWRDHSPSEALRALAKLDWRGQAGELTVDVSGASTELVGNGAAPVQLLARRRAAVFTRPDRTNNRLLAANASARRSLAGAWSLAGNIHFRGSDIDTHNGDDSEYEACAEPAGVLCLNDEPAVDLAATPINASDGIVGATINRTRTEQRTFGASAEATWRGALGGTTAWFAGGATLDASRIDFASSVELGRLDDTRLAVPGGVFPAAGPVLVEASLDNASLYASFGARLHRDTSLRFAARYNGARVELRDGLGTALDGNHRFGRLNPAIGVEHRRPGFALYVRYGESNRVPSPVELTCADEDAPCRLPNAFLADPPLDQVVARTVELGLRGRGTTPWRAVWFRTRTEAEILFISAGRFTSEGYFDNIGGTLRQGLELSLDGSHGRVGWFLRGALVSARFKNAFRVPGERHPAAVAGGIEVAPGDRLPLVPERLAKAGVSVQATARLRISARALYASRHHLRGDEGNLAPALAAHTRLNLRAAYQAGPRLALTAAVDNALDESYETFGVFGEADEVLGDEFDNPRFVSPGTPRGAWLGVELKL